GRLMSARQTPRAGGGVANGVLRPRFTLLTYMTLSFEVLLSLDNRLLGGVHNWNYGRLFGQSLYIGTTPISYTPNTLQHIGKTLRATGKSITQPALILIHIPMELTRHIPNRHPLPRHQLSHLPHPLPTPLRAINAQALTPPEHFHCLPPRRLVLVVQMLADTFARHARYPVVVAAFACLGGVVMFVGVTGGDAWSK
ncbi:hypothetical protein B0H34DRAFT_690625, partial [Crassisporium funariophilum]